VTGTPDRLAAALSDRYRIERELGQGGMATVYLAHDLKHDRNVALKVLKPELAAVLGAERFVVEIKTTAALQHPHILPLFDSGTAGGFLFYVMPFIDGETLRSRLDRETQLGVDEAVKITTAVADALDYAHRHGVIHRDIKPENILLHEGRPMVADFGIALALSAAAGGRMTETGLSLGTPHYMSPEQATAEREITARSDIYSLGSVLYEMLTGEPPHMGNSAQAIIMKIVTEDAQPVTRLRKSVPPNVAAAVAKAVERLPADRFESAARFAEALANPAFGAGTQRLVAAAGMAGGRVVSLRVFAATAAAGVVALLAALWAWSRPVESPAVSRLELVMPDSQPLTTNLNGNRLALSPDGRLAVYAGLSTGGRRYLYLRRLDQLAVELIPGTEGALNPAFDPAGQRIAFVSGTPLALKVVSLAGAPPVVLTDSLVDSGGVSWGYDGYIYYDGRLEGDGLARIREAGGSPEPATTPADPTESWHAMPAALPSGRGVLFGVSRLRGATYDIAVLDTRSGVHRVLVQGVRPLFAPSGHLIYATLEGTLMAVRFDQDKLETRGDPVALAGGVYVGGLGRADIAIANNGTMIYASGGARGRPSELVWISRTGAISSVDSTWLGDFRGRPALSPDGNSLAIALFRSSASDVWVKALDRGVASKLADRGSGSVWSPNGSDIAFTVLGADISIGPADGSRLPEVRYRTLRNLQGIEYSADGEWMIVTMEADIAAIPTSGDSTPRVLVASSALDRRATIHPGGDWFAYESNEGGTPQIYVRPFPDAQRARRQVSSGIGMWPRWSRDGRELFYLTETGAMVAVPVTTEPTFSTGNPQVLFTLPETMFALPFNPFDVHPDGRFLMARMIRGGVEEGDRLVVVQHFFEELRNRVPE